MRGALKPQPPLSLWVRPVSQENVGRAPGRKTRQQHTWLAGPLMAHPNPINENKDPCLNGHPVVYVCVGVGAGGGECGGRGDGACSAAPVSHSISAQDVFAKQFKIGSKKLLADS